MVGFGNFDTMFWEIIWKRLQTPIPITPEATRCFHLGVNSVYRFANSTQNLAQLAPRRNVAILWNLDNRPPKSVSPFDAAIRLKKAASSFGPVRYMIAYANPLSLSYAPPEMSEQRKNRKSRDVVKPAKPFLCRVCGRKFYNHEKFLNHFKQIHESEHIKRMSQIDSARGSRRVKLVGRYSMKMEKYKNATREILTPKAGYGLEDELKRAGFWVRSVSGEPQAVDAAFRNHVAEIMDGNRVKCLVLVSDDSDFVEVLKEARLRSLKTVVVGDVNDGALKRVSDASFSWKEIMAGKAKKEAVSVLGKWKDRDVLKRLEWSYDPEREKKLYGSTGGFDDTSEGSDAELFLSGDDDDNAMNNCGTNPWWKLECDPLSPTRK